MELQELPFTIVYRPGCRNQVADYLSRNPELNYDEGVNRETTFEDIIFTTEGSSKLLAKILEAQTRDGVVQKALTEIVQEGRVCTGQFLGIADKLKNIGKNLYFGNRVVVPTELRQETILLTHAQHHFGQAGTTRSLRRNLFWPRMVRDVRSFCRSCITCQSSKHKTSGSEPMTFSKVQWAIRGVGKKRT